MPRAKNPLLLKNFAFFKEKLAVFQMFSGGQLPILLFLAVPMILMILLHMEPAIFSKKTHCNQNHIMNNDFYLQIMHFLFLFIFICATTSSTKRKDSKTLGVMACADINIKNKIYWQLDGKAVSPKVKK